MTTTASLDRSSDFDSDFLANNTPGEIRLPMLLENTSLVFCKREEEREMRDRRNHEGEEEAANGRARDSAVRTGKSSKPERRVTSG